MTELQGDEALAGLSAMQGVAGNIQTGVSWCFIALAVIVVFVILIATRRHYS